MSNQTFKDRVITVWKEKRPDIKSVRKLEEEIELSNGSISSWSKSSPTQEKVQKVADFFGVSVDYLLGNKNNTTDDDDVSEFYRVDLSHVPVADRDKVKASLDTFTRFLLDDLED